METENIASPPAATPPASSQPVAAPHAAHDSSHVPTHSAPGTGKRLLIIVVTLAVVLLSAYLIIRHGQRRDEEALTADAQTQASKPEPVDVAHVEYASPVSLLSLPAEAHGLYQTTLYARVSGYLKDWKVDIGDHVKAGQVLATIETPDLDDQLAEAQAKVAAAKADAHLAETAAEFTKLTFARWESAVPDGVVSRQERDQKKADFDNSIAKLESAQAQIKLSEAAVQRLSTLERFKNVTAPFDGVITQRQVDIGDLVTAGSSTNTSPLFSICQADKIRVFVQVPQSAAPEIKLGMEALVSARELPNKKFLGKVDRTTGAIDPRSKTLGVEILVPNPALLLMPGEYLEASFQSSRTDPPLRVPASALCFRSTGPQVAVVDDNGVLTFHDVTIARDLGDLAEISSGLKPTDVVALNISHDLSTGDRITPVAMDKQPSPTTQRAPVAMAAHPK